jgi:hypothetical protein
MGLYAVNANSEVKRMVARISIAKSAVEETRERTAAQANPVWFP